MAAPETLVPRRYQEEVFTQAQRGNVIAALGTGSGKTYISSLLMKWNATRETSQGKVVIFLVPKVALVEQQGEFLEKTTSLRVTKLHGTSPNIDLSDRSRWIQRFQTTDVFVFTAVSEHFNTLDLEYR
ncbi:Dicer-like protein 1 [Stygiomarasmius scandens]|uniref:Dicer-like protein 1 n=1 Tax=Marasmiellus scandens TaxID=2682957 RepID=A0ABR1K4T3_9AGAR